MPPDLPYASQNLLITTWTGLSDQNATICYKHVGPLDLRKLHTFVCPKKTLARLVRIIIHNSPLRLCEVHVFSIKSASKGQCPSVSGLRLWNIFADQCIYGSLQTATYEEARKACGQFGGTLLIDPHGIYRPFVIAYLNHNPSTSSQFYWIGYKMISPGRWEWQNGLLTSNELIPGSLSTVEFWNDRKSKEINSSALFYGAVMTDIFHFRWLPSLQAVWYNWICQLPVSRCSFPGQPINCGVKVSEDAPKVNSSAVYFCEKDLELVGPHSRNCQKTGLWTDETPICSSPTCAIPDQFLGLKTTLLNGTTTVDSVVEHICEEKLLLIGSDVECPPPPDIENGFSILLDNDTVYSSRLRYECFVGFNLRGSYILQCNSSGLWSNYIDFPTCELSPLVSPLVFENLRGKASTILISVLLSLIFAALLLITIVYKRNKRFRASLLSIYENVSASSLINGFNAGQSKSSNSEPDVLYAFPNNIGSESSRKSESSLYSGNIYETASTVLPYVPRKDNNSKSEYRNRFASEIGKIVYLQPVNGDMLVYQELVVSTQTKPLSAGE
uniref:Uncharacterized protein n=1 Tax=Romanomermis culicivorax TaxID=13658 RepID=A0A915IKC0_ROMCU